MMKTEILLINPLAGFDGLKSKGGYTEPLSLGYIASYIAQKEGYNPKIINCSWYDFPYFLKKYKPKLLGLSVNIMQYRPTAKMVRYAKRYNPKIKVILGGYIPTFCYKEIFEKLSSSVDVQVLGEGERTFLELCDYFFKKKGRLNEIKGIAYLENRKLIVTPQRELIKNLDELPFPIRDPKMKTASILVSRGCPFNCRFCSIKNFYHRTYRVRSIKNIIKELLVLKKAGVKRVNVLDDNFALNYDFFRSFYHEYMKNRLNFSLWLLASAKQIADHPDILEMMRRMNVESIQIGMETVDEASREFLDINAKIPNPKDFVNAVKKSSYKNEIIVFQILNTGFEHSIDEIKKKSYRFYNEVKEIKNLKIVPYLMQPYPGADLTKIFEKEGMLARNFDFFEKLGANIQSKWISARELENFLIEYNKFLISKKKLRVIGSYNLRGFFYVTSSSLRLLTKIKVISDILFSFFVSLIKRKPFNLNKIKKKYFGI